MEQYTKFLEAYNNEKFGLRLSELREKKGVSARKMSLELGQNKNYINGIESGNYFPTMHCFFEICYYLKVSPSDFFQEKPPAPRQETDISELLYHLPPHVFRHFSQIVHDFIENSSY